MTNALNQAPQPNPRLIWTGRSGTRYEFEHYPIYGTAWNAVGGVYIFCKLAPDGRWYAQYIGETDNFRRRLSDELGSHHQWNCISRSGATHVCAMVVNGGDTAQRRLDIEADLRHSQNPPCNRQ